MFSSHPTSLLLACVAAAAASVDAHGYMMTPKCNLASGDPTRFASEVRGQTVLQVPAGGSFSNTPQINVDSFTKAFKASTFKSLRQLIEEKTPTGKTCGITPPGGDPQDVPDAVVYSGFADSHVGPCEVWCDNKRVFQEDNCAGKYPQKPATLPISKAECSGASELRFYWLALHSQDWQVYVSCAPLKGASAGGNNNNSNNNNGGGSPAVTPAPSTARPSNNNHNKPPSPVPAPAPNNGGGNNKPPANNNNKGEVGGDSDSGKKCHSTKRA